MTILDTCDEIIQAASLATELLPFPLICDSDYDLFCNLDNPPETKPIEGIKQQIGSIHYGCPAGPYMVLAANHAPQLAEEVKRLTQLLEENRERRTTLSAVALTVHDATERKLKEAVEILERLCCVKQHQTGFNAFCLLKLRKDAREFLKKHEV